MTQETAAAPIRPKGRLRFSLRTLLLLVVAVCVALGYRDTWRRMRAAEQEVRIRRDESGYLSVEDRTQLHAIVVPTDEPNTWRWRLFVPKGPIILLQSRPYERRPDGSHGPSPNPTAGYMVWLEEL